MPKHRHDCAECVFMGTDSQGADWYVHDAPSKRGLRTLIRRFSSEPSDYESGTIGETVKPQRIVVLASRMGFVFNEAEMECFANAYIAEFTAYKSMQDSREGPSEEDENLLSRKGEGK